MGRDEVRSTRRNFLVGGAGVAAAGLTGCSLTAKKESAETKGAERADTSAPVKNWTVAESEKAGTADHKFDFVKAKFGKVAGGAHDEYYSLECARPWRRRGTPG